MYVKRMRWFFFVLGLLITVTSCLHSPKDAQRTDLRLSTATYVRTAGPGLLRGQQWEQAGEVYGVRPEKLREAVASLMNDTSIKGSEGDLFRYRLLNFYFLHMDFSGGNTSPGFFDVPWIRACREIERYAVVYGDLLGSVPASERESALEFSCLDLMSEMAAREQASSGLTKLVTSEDKSRVFAALEKNPDSIPVAAALMRVITRRGSKARDARAVDWEKAMETFKSPFGKLTLARTLNVSCKQVPSEVVRSILQEGLHLAPSNQQQADLLYKLAVHETHVAASNKDGSLAEVAYVTAMRVCEEFAQTESAPEARRLVVSLLLDAKRPQSAMDFVRRLKKQEDPYVEKLDREMFSMSTVFFEKGYYDQSVRILSGLIRDYPGTGTASRAMLGLAEVYAKKGDSQKELEWLKRCAELRKTEPTGLGIMDTDNTRSLAIQRLAGWYEQNERWEEALSWWEKWQTSSWCGNCIWGMEYRKAHHTELCLLKLGKVDKALGLLEPYVFGEEAHLFDRSEIPIIVANTYLERKRYRELMKKLETAAAESENNRGARIALEYINLRRMGEQKDVDGLWNGLGLSWRGENPFDEDDNPSWKEKEIARLLLSMPDATKPVLVSKLKGKFVEGRCAAVLLAKMKVAEIVPALKENIENKKSLYYVRDYFYALAILGTEEAHKIIRDHAKKSTDCCQRAAQRMLGKFSISPH